MEMSAVFAKQPKQSQKAAKPSADDDERDATIEKKPEVETAKPTTVVTSDAGEKHAVEVPVEDLPQGEDGYKKALSASRKEARERDKAAREAEKRLQEMERELMELRGWKSAADTLVPKPTPTKKEPEPEKPIEFDPADFFDPEKARRIFGEIETRAEKRAYERAKTEFESWKEKEFTPSQEKAWMKELNRSERIAREKHKDWLDAWKFFEGEMDNDPSLLERWRNHDDPAEFAYSTAKTLMAFKEAGGSIDAYRQKIENEARERVLAEIAAGKTNESPEEKPTKPPIPKESLAGARGTGASVNKTYAGRPSLKEVFGKPKK